MKNLIRNAFTVLWVVLAILSSLTASASAAGQISTSGSISIKYTNLNETSLKLNLPTVKTSGVSRKIEWLRSGNVIKGATKTTYTLKAADKNKFLQARLTFSKSGYKTKVIKSNRKYVPSGVLAGKYELLWQDEFSGAEGSLSNSEFWTAQEGDGSAAPFNNPGWGNTEIQYYLNEMAKLNGSGQLVITATKTGASSYSCYYGPCQWLSSKLVTLDKVGFKYGRIEVRAKGAKGEGTWPAVWTLGANIDEVGWPTCGEIDIMELKGNWPGGLWGTGHGPISSGPGRGGDWSVVNPSTTEDFHVYAIEWFEDRIDWFVDGKLYYTYENVDADWVFDAEQYLILNLAMGGHWGGAIDFDLTETEFTLDYVRYYSINGLGELFNR